MNAILGSYIRLVINAAVRAEKQGKGAGHRVSQEEAEGTACGVKDGGEKQTRNCLCYGQGKAAPLRF